MNTQRGQRDKLDKYLNVNQEIEVVMAVAGASVYDFTCFGLDADSKLSDDTYMVFYNQIQSPNNEISYQASGNEAHFLVNLNQLPEKIQKLAFTVSIDGAGTMGMIQNHTVFIKQNGQSILELCLNGSDFQNQTAIISMEIYKKDVWRFSMVASGFDGGLGDLLRNYGGEELEEEQTVQQQPIQQQPMQQFVVPQQQFTALQQQFTVPQQQFTAPQQQFTVPQQQFTAPQQQFTAPQQQFTAPQQQFTAPQQQFTAPQSLQQSVSQQQTSVRKVSLEKKLEQGAPKLVSLAKPLMAELEKRNLLDCVARVALVLDISGSMTGRYKNGTVQEIVNKTLPLAVQFDDDGQLDFWYYGTTCRRMPSVSMKNYEKAVPEDWRGLMRALGGSNNEVLVMEDIQKKYKGTKLPVYVLFITDGGVAQAGKIKKIMREVSKEPIFWQFVGVGGRNYGVLEQLDDMKDRYVDNADFFALDDFMKVSAPEIYSRLLNEFPSWLDEIKTKGMI